LIVLLILFISFRLIAATLNFDNYTSNLKIIKELEVNTIKFEEILTNKNITSLINIDKNKKSLKFAFALVDKKTNKLIPYDPSFFIIKGYSKNKTINKESYLTNCNENFFHLKNEQYVNYQIEKSYCFYSKNNFKYEYNENPDFEGFYMKLNKCINDTHSLVERKYLPSYQRLIEKEKNIEKKNNENIININDKEEKIFGLNNDIYDYYPSNFTNINFDILNDEIVRLNKINVLNPLICKSEDDIYEYLNKIKIRFYYDSFSENLTNFDNPIFRKFSYYETNLNDDSEKRVVIYFLNSTLGSQKGITPLSLNGNLNYYNYQEFNSIKFSYIKNKNRSLNIKSLNLGNEDFHEADTMLRIIISLSGRMKIIQRTYRDILTIMGNIGGFSRFIMIFMSILLSYYIKIRRKEALINELYSSNEELSTKIKKKIKGGLTKVEYSTFQNCYLYLMDIYKENGYENYEEEFRKNVFNLNTNKLAKNIIDYNTNAKENKNKYSEAFDINNLENQNISEEDSVNCEFKYSNEEIYLIQLKLQNLYTESYIDVSNENGKFYKFWKVDDSDPEKKSKEFYNRVALRALIKFFFFNKSKFYDDSDYLEDKNSYDNVIISKKGEEMNKNNLKKNNFDLKHAEYYFKDLVENVKNENFIKTLTSDFINKLEYINYSNLIENLSKKNNEIFHFNIIWMYFMFCFKKCTTKKYQEHLDKFDEIYDEILEQSEFKNIYSSLQEFKRFKNTYFEKGQLYMFESCPKKVLSSNSYNKEELLGNGIF
jgi:hypothetical protein